MGLVASFYRKLLVSTAVAGMAGLPFAVADPHVMSAGWLAGRNALPCLGFGMGMLHLHVSWSRTHARRHLFLAVVLYAVGLGCGEAVLGAAARTGGGVLLVARAAILPAPLDIFARGLAKVRAGSRSRNRPSFSSIAATFWLSTPTSSGRPPARLPRRAALPNWPR